MMLASLKCVLLMAFFLFGIPTLIKAAQNRESIPRENFVAIAMSASVFITLQWLI